MDNPFYITTPIYYVNAKPHLGHTYTTIACDTMARHHRLMGDDVFFLTGTDEHGDKIVKAAEKNGQTPESYTNEISSLFQTAWNALHITNDQFIRTTDEAHKNIVKEVLQKIYDKGDIYLSEYEGTYCTGCERYLTEKELTEDGLCPDHQIKPDVIKEKNYFFKMQKYLPIWLEELENNPDLIRPERYYKEAVATIRELIDLGEDLSISRPKSRLSWGIELPFDESYVTYVWFDALLNYVSALDYPESTKFNRYWPVVNHMIAKDILKPHGIYWPTMLMAAGIPIYQKLLVHGYWLGWGDMKMSKSLGNALDPHTLLDKIGEDNLRFFLMREMVFGNDSRFTEEALQSRINTDLSNDIGNLLQRTMSMIKKYMSSSINPSKKDIAFEEKMEQLITSVIPLYFENMAEYMPSRAIEEIFRISRAVNTAIEENKPWQMAKENHENLEPFLTSVMKTILFILYYLRPFIPQKSEALFQLLDLPYDSDYPKKLADISLPANLPEKWEILFPRLDLDLS